MQFLAVYTLVCSSKNWVKLYLLVACFLFSPLEYQGASINGVLNHSGIASLLLYRDHATYGHCTGADPESSKGTHRHKYWKGSLGVA